MKSKEKFSRIILAFLKDNKNKKFTVKEIGESCFCGQGMEYHHNVSEFLTWLNEMGYVRWFFNGVETRRKDIKEKVIGGLYQYKCGDGISTNDKILDLWRKDTLDFFVFCCPGDKEYVDYVLSMGYGSGYFKIKLLKI